MKRIFLTINVTADQKKKIKELGGKNMTKWILSRLLGTETCSNLKEEVSLKVPDPVEIEEEMPVNTEPEAKACQMAYCGSKNTKPYVRSNGQNFQLCDAHKP